MLGRIGVAVVGVLILVAVAAAVLLDSAWGHERIRQLIVSQSNRVLTGTLEIDRIDGSILRGIELSGVRLVQDGVPVIAIARADVDYSIPELYRGGTLIRHLRLERLQVTAAQDAEGRWNLGRLVRPRPARPPSGNPPRPVTFDHVEIVDGTIEFRNQLLFGPTNVPRRFEALNADLSFELRAPAWSLTLHRAAWHGLDPELTVTNLTGGLATDASGWTFNRLRVETPRSDYTVGGSVRRAPAPTVLDLDIAATRLAFQEWGGLLGGLKNIAVDAAFTARLSGPLDRLATTIAMKSTGGGIDGSFVLDSSVPGWHGAGVATVSRLDLARWFNRPDRPSDISGQVDFDLDLDLGRHFPRGKYTFAGSHAAYIGYAADNVRATGTLTATDALIASATATAYGADVRVRDGRIAIDAPYGYRFAGRAAGVDLRLVPRDVPVPHVESTLVLDYDVHGQFTPATLAGHAVFDASEFLGAQIGRGTVGSIDTGQSSADRVRYTGEGDISGISLRRFGEGLDVAWMRDPRYDGFLAGHFHVQGTGAEAATMTLDGGGRLTQAELFQGTLRDADVDVHIADGSLRGMFDGALEHVNPAIAFADERFTASLTGRGRATFAVAGMLVRDVTLADYTIDADATFGSTSVRTVALDRAHVQAHLADEMLGLTAIDVSGPTLQASGRGTVALDDVRASAFDYDVTRGDLAVASEMLGRPLAGSVSTQGRLTGTLSVPRLTGNLRLSRVTAGAVEALAGAVDYDTTWPADRPIDATARLSGSIGPLTIGSQAINDFTGAAALDHRLLTLDLRGTRAGGVNASLTTTMRVADDWSAVAPTRLTLTVQSVAWQLAGGGQPHIARTATGFTIRDLVLVDVNGEGQRIAVDGEWGNATADGLRIRATGVSIDTLAGAVQEPPRYGGRLDADARVHAPNGAGSLIVTGTFTVVDGRVRRLTYDKLAATVGYDDGVFSLDARLDQRPGVWLQANGNVPLALFVDGAPDRAMRVAVTSSAIDLGILEGLTDRVRDVAGTLQVNVTAIGQASDPHFDGTVDISNAGFVVNATGARYRNTRLNVALGRDQVTVKALHVEDGRGRGLDVTGSLGTHELRVGDLAVRVQAKQFEVMRNEFGNTEVDADLSLSGQFESPRLTGEVTVTGGELNVDEILDRVLLRPYSTEALEPRVTTGGELDLDPLTVLNPWERMGIDLTVRSRGTMRMIGENVQVSSGTPLGLGNVNVRAFGEIYLYKDPAQPLFITGSLDSLIGTYAFQGRRFDLDPTSSIVFRGDLNPELYITVRRVINAVEARVAIVGPLNEPELRLSSTPALDESNILSLIVFNSSINELNAVQQQELAVRAGTLAAGFLTTPLVSALERSLGLDILEIDLQPAGPGSATAAPRVTIGDEIAPGLVARFSRQFGPQEYSEASIEYYLSRLFRIRATFSDATSLVQTTRFRRIERAGIDLLVFFSF